MKKRLAPLLAVFLLLIVGCASKPCSLPPDVPAAAMIGFDPVEIQLVRPDGSSIQPVIIDPKDYDELQRELKGLRNWRDAVKLLHGKKLSGPPSAPHADKSI